MIFKKDKKGRYSRGFKFKSRGNLVNTTLDFAFEDETNEELLDLIFLDVQLL